MTDMDEFGKQMVASEMFNKYIKCPLSHLHNFHTCNHVLTFRASTSSQRGWIFTLSSKHAVLWAYIKEMEIQNA